MATDRNMKADLLQYAERLLMLGGFVGRPTSEQIKEAIDAMRPMEQVKLLAMRSAYRNAGGQTNGRTSRTVPLNANMAERLAWLVNDFDYTTPTDGSVFWTGIDHDRLTQVILSFNKENPNQLVGGLEATTPARFLDGQVEGWNDGEAGREYFNAASVALGKGASGHVTAVQRFGLQTAPDKVFTNKEFPAILKQMDDDLAKGIAPRVTDITIVVLEPLGSDNRCELFTNQRILLVDLVSNASNQPQIYTRADARSAGKVGWDGVTEIPDRVLEYWTRQGPKQACNTALMLARRIEDVVYR